MSFIFVLLITRWNKFDIFKNIDIPFVTETVKLITRTTPYLCSVHVCVWGGVYFIFVHTPDSDNSKSQLPAGTVTASHEEEDLPTSHRRCGSFSPIWPVDEQTHRHAQ